MVVPPLGMYASLSTPKNNPSRTVKKTLQSHYIFKKAFIHIGKKKLHHLTTYLELLNLASLLIKILHVSNIPNLVGTVLKS
jgi:hypothetical protein